MTDLDHDQLQRDLLALFDKYDLRVAVGLTHDGVTIRSQDERVDVANIGPVNKQFRLERDVHRPNA